MNPFLSAILTCGLLVCASGARAGDYAASTWDGAPVRVERPAVAPGPYRALPAPAPRMVVPREVVSAPAPVLVPRAVYTQLADSTLPRGVIYNEPPAPGPAAWAGEPVIRARY